MSPSIGAYNPQNYTIADNCRKKIEQGAGNPLLSSIKEKPQAPFNSAKERFVAKNVDENDKFLGPGYYEVKTFVDNQNTKVGSNLGKFNSNNERFQKTSGF